MYQEFLVVGVNLFTNLEAVLTIRLHVPKFEGIPTACKLVAAVSKWGTTELIPELDQARVGDTVLAF